MSAFKEVINLRLWKEYLVTCTVIRGILPGMNARTMSESRSNMRRYQEKPK